MIKNIQKETPNASRKRSTQDLLNACDRNLPPLHRKVYIESYGCQMNFSDSEIISAIMEKQGFTLTSSCSEADLIFINTCAIRDKAEQTIRNRLLDFNQQKIKHPDLIIGVLGCMAERLKIQLLEEEKVVDIVAGPDAYRDLPRLIHQVDQGYKAVNTFLSKEETYADIEPVRLNSNGVTAFISIMRGCNNMCSFCIVPFTRGRERSRDPHSIVEEAKKLFDKGYKEITLLGQNVDSYNWTPTNATATTVIHNNQTVHFAKLLAMVADIDPSFRVRFSTSHPKDITDEVLYTIKAYDNICKHIHLPVQSGNSRILKLMNRTYDRAWYIQKIDAIRTILGPSCAISSDMISGFCSETEEEHTDTLTLMDYVKYDFSFMFYYSERPGTLAARKYPDDVSEEIKRRRLSEIIAKQREHGLFRNQQHLHQVQQVLIEKDSRKSPDFFQGRNSQNKIVVFPKGIHQVGSYVDVHITNCNAATLFGEVC
ncbi:tRNA (N6-isopentenyl adenosine(37)-C2)-methylthiotransferase MiaB [Cardinium endosymbiont of Culicoides punctatus]|uniref:tRNA (N6-isopentenyl adenosine(37)-C2)-methylthiotransferase MiaB n=1 Tax=Cardinium endosymbiont of Culicoides punctatus TaxID=2304601 RepID=UPI001058A4CE|nr:tRNA (N6-isopentenyl adenosine(37)-C2)-methylthiotransferase MiaB [Cardinium endosymbiont of Culicoides punctatus]TDG95517.1 tRNA-2-methylthio-N(6)-dimethylallyladenosine synthase [Cardinium endosymbiont of Culicoides punctatus]